MDAVFLISAVLAVVAMTLAITSSHAVHGLLYLLLGLLALSVNLFEMGNELGGVLLVIIYAGAIMVLFVFVVMLLNLSPTKKASIGSAVFLKKFILPLVLAIAIFVEFAFALFSGVNSSQGATFFSAKQIASVLFQDAWVFVELLSLLLTAALVGAFHIGKRRYP